MYKEKNNNFYAWKITFFEKAKTICKSIKKSPENNIKKEIKSVIW